MALTRKSLKAMGLTDEQVDSIVEMHTETVDGWKEKLKTAEEKANKLDACQKELDELKADGGKYGKDAYNKLKKEFDDYKSEMAAKETKTAKDAAVRAYFEGKNITGDNLDIAMLAVSGLIDGIDLDGETIKDTKTLDDLVSGKLSKLIVKTQQRGANPATPPAGGGGKMTKADIMKIKDTAERQRAIAQNLEAFRK